MMLNDLTVSYRYKNHDRKWYKLWKSRYIDKEITMNNAQITITDTQVVGNELVYRLTAGSKHIADEFTRKMEI